MINIAVAKEVKTTTTPQVTSKSTKGFDIDKLARAVAQWETTNCTKGIGPKYNNCFGIKNGSIAPCKKKASSGMCIYNHPSESYVAFKKIWREGYGNKFPTVAMATRWSGDDNAAGWIKHVTKFYNSY